MKNRNLNHSDNWETPKDFYSKLNDEFNFDFDPCPIMYEEITEDNDGLLIEWGNRNFINPPYSQKLKEKFVLKAIEESKKGKLCVLLIPVSTSTKLFHEHIQPNAKEIRFIKGRLSFSGINQKGEYVNWHNSSIEAPDDAVHVKNSGMHDSMIVIFENDTNYSKHQECIDMLIDIRNSIDIYGDISNICIDSINNLINRLT